MTHYLNIALSPRYRGNLHLHTANSDGRAPLAQAAAWYRDHHYDFIAITDHNRLTDVNGLSTPDFLVIPASEIDVECTALGQPYHLVAIGLHEAVTYADRRAVKAQDAINELNQRGAAVVLAHPYWSGLTVSEMLPLDGLLGLEVYNTSGDRDLGKGLAAVHWDDVLVRGKRWWGVAVDDTHWRDDDSGGGWVVVEAAELSEAAIVAALQEGRFYASTGPDIYDLSLNGGTLTVRCSPVSVINVIGHTQWGDQWRASPGQPLTGAAYTIRGTERYLRVECIDNQGRTAWSNPIFL